MEINAKVKLPNKLLSLLQNYPRDVTKVLAGALVMEAETIMTSAKRLTPVLSGALRSSGHVQTPTVGMDTVTVLLGFGGVAAPYAVYVHEDMTKHHNNGQAKFLEQPFNAAKEGLITRIADTLKRAIR